MPKSDDSPAPFRCPKCRGGDLVIYEHFTVMDAYKVVGGRVVERDARAEAHSQMKFSAACECGHIWNCRWETGQRAVDAAGELEAH